MTLDQELKTLQNRLSQVDAEIYAIEALDLLETDCPLHNRLAELYEEKRELAWVQE